MTTRDMLETVKLYQSILAEAGIEPLDDSSAQELIGRQPDLPRKPFDFTSQLHLAYCGWMLGMMRDMVGNGDRTQADKFVRWLCFVQGVFWDNGLLAIQEARDHVRPLVRK